MRKPGDIFTQIGGLLITYEEIEGMLESAIDCQNYFLIVDYVKPDPYTIEYIGNILEDMYYCALNPGGAIVFVDFEENYTGDMRWSFDEIDVEEDIDPSAERLLLNKESIIQGLNLFCNWRPEQLNEFIEDPDSENGEIFIQFCLFGEIVYG